MAVSIFDENTPQDGLEFKPFNESPVKAVQITTVTRTGSMDTTEIDAFRQGVEISSETYRFKGLGAKIWAGNIKGYTSIKTIGQSVSFTEYKNDKKFNDLLVKFNPVSYIELGENYPYPLIFNEGPQQNKEASIQPFTIPFRNGRDTNEAQDVAHQVRGSVEDGNQNNLYVNGYTDKITQFVPFYNAAQEHSPFLDEGDYTFGDTEDGGIKIQGYLNSAEINIVPFDDRSTRKLLDQFTNVSDDLFIVLTQKSSSIDLDEDLRENYYQKSATAGRDVYGPGQARTGSDSIAFTGFLLGN